MLPVGGLLCCSKRRRAQGDSAIHPKCPVGTYPGYQERGCSNSWLDGVGGPDPEDHISLLLTFL